MGPQMPLFGLTAFWFRSNLGVKQIGVRVCPLSARCQMLAVFGRAGWTNVVQRRFHYDEA